MAFKLVIFDCDGVLVDSETLASRVFTQMLAAHGHRISSSESEDRFRGVKLASILETLERETGIALPESFETELRERMSAVFREQLQPVAGVHRLVESLQIPFCVASSGPRQKIEANLKTTELYPHFEGRVFSGYEVNSWKPEPGLFLAAARHFNVVPGDCLVIEDSVVGVTAAIAAQMTVFALNARAGDNSLVEANRIFTSLDEIREYFVSLNLSRK